MPNCKFIVTVRSSGAHRTYHGLYHAEFLCEGLALQVLVAIEEVADKGAHRARVGGRPERKQKERVIECCSVQAHVLASWQVSHDLDKPKAI